MEGIIETTAKLVRGILLIYERKTTFLAIFLCMFVVNTLVLGAFDLLPNGLSNASTNSLAADLEKSSLSALAATSTTPPTGTIVEDPVKIEIPSLALTATIANPTTTAVKVLDELLLKGAVRYPTSAKLGENGNVVVFGHSSYLPVVFNQAFKTFDGIQKLKQGDIVTVYSSGTAYTYKVRTMNKESAKDAVIPLTVTGRVLTLATCNSFGEKTDRFVVTADFVESHSSGA
jgi:LPXTG-site transpeptidase (sortase) family protein